MTRFLLLLSLLSQPLEESKLGIHLIGRLTEGAKRIIEAGPPVIKVLDPQAVADMREAIILYKKKYPSGLVVVRVWEGTPAIRFSQSNEPERSADLFWTKVLEPALKRLPEKNRRLIDYLEGPNEGENCPTWESVESAHWFGRFWVRLARRIREGGMRPCVGSIAVGNPPGTIDEIYSKLGAFLPALRTAKECGGSWSYHAYSLQYTTDPTVEIWYSLRYRLSYNYLSKTDRELARFPLILTEGGIDRAGNPHTDGWRARGDRSRFVTWLQWFDDELHKDEFVKGVTLFQIGDPQGWFSFDLEEASDWIAQHIKRMKQARQEGG